MKFNRILLIPTVTILIIFTNTLITSALTAQTILNPSFDSVTIGGIDRIYAWIPSTSNPIKSGGSNIIYPLVPDSCYKWLDPMIIGEVNLEVNFVIPGLTIALQNTNLIKPDSTPFETFIVNGGRSFHTNSEGYIDFSKCGEPFPYRPDYLNVQYKYIDAQFNSRGKCIILLKKFNSTTNSSDTIAHSIGYLPPASGWTKYPIPITYKSSATPDFIVILFFASTHPKNTVKFYIDDLTFTYPTSVVVSTGVVDLWSVYPNPVNGVLQIDGHERFSAYRIIAMNGIILKEGAYTDNIDVSGIRSKTFVLELTDDNQNVQSFKIVKE